MTVTKAKQGADDKLNQTVAPADLPTCGIVMPISAFDGYSEGHWKEVLTILKDSASQAGFNPNLVSHAEESGIIQRRIIENLYKNDMVICDISGKNANVMLELGIRLAFDKPTIVVKDDTTTFSFDITPMEHIIYRSDLRYQSILDFKSDLTGKIEATHQSAKNKTLVGFIKSFGDFESVKFDEKEVSSQQFIIDKLNALEQQLTKPTQPKPVTKSAFWTLGTQPTQRIFEVTRIDDEKMKKLMSDLHEISGVVNVASTFTFKRRVSGDHEPMRVIIHFHGEENEQRIIDTLTKYTTILSIELL